MKLTTGYKKPIDSDSNVLLAGGGHKTIQQIINDFGVMSIAPAITFSQPINADILGNATTANRLSNPVNIAGVSFDGSSNIILTASNVGALASTHAASGVTSTKITHWDAAYTHSTSTHAPTDAQKNVQSDWTATSGDALILNKPPVLSSTDFNTLITSLGL